LFLAHLSKLAITACDRRSHNILYTANARFLILTALTASLDGALKEEKFKSPWDHFNGLDPSISIPAYLRSNAKVQRTFLSYKETIRFIQEVRTAKENDKSLAPLQVPPNHYKHIEAVEPDKVPFSQFFESFLKVKNTVNRDPDEPWEAPYCNMHSARSGADYFYHPAAQLIERLLLYFIDTTHLCYFSSFFSSSLLPTTTLLFGRRIDCRSIGEI
jgi:hypothetical protein